MNQRVLLLSASLTVCLAAAAQPTLTEANNAPQPTDLFPISSSSADSILTSAGAMETYGCWMLLEASNRDVHFIDPAATSTSNTIPGTEVISTDGGADTLFWSSDATGLFLVGERTIATFAYSDPVKELAYPCTFGTTWSDNASATFTVSGFNVVRSTTLTGEGTGYGTLQLPSGSVNDVLRVSVRKQTTDQSIATIVRTSNITYFFVDTVQYPILRLQVDSVTISGGAPGVTYTNEWMYGQGDVGVEDLSAADITFTAYPNPVNDLLTLPVSVNGAATCEVIDAAGRVVLTRTLGASSATHQLPVNGLPAGMYTARIVDADGMRTTRFQVAR
jgi:hypothetical protein